MALTALSPILYTDQLEASINFYTTILGFNCSSHEPAWGWASLEQDQVHIMLSKPNAHLPFNGPKLTGSIYIYTDQVEAEWSRLKDKVKVAYEMEDFDYGMREFGIFDNNGYLLQYGSPWDH